MAVPVPASPTSTVTSLPLAGVRDTVKVSEALPSSPSTTLGESRESEGVSSSSVIVPVPLAAPRAAPSALARVTTMVSSDSRTLSSVRETATVFVVSFAPKVSFPPANAV